MKTSFIKQPSGWTAAVSRETAEVPPLHPSVSGVSALLRVRALVLMTGGHVESRGGEGEERESYGLSLSLSRTLILSFLDASSRTQRVFLGFCLFTYMGKVTK